MANGDPLRAGQRVDATDDTILDAYPYPNRVAGLLVRNYVFRPGAPTIPPPLSAEFIGIQGEGTTGVAGIQGNSQGAGVAGLARNPGATGVYGTGGDTAVWGNGIPTALPGSTRFSVGADIGVMGDAVDNAGVFGISWFGCGVLGEGFGPQTGVHGTSLRGQGVVGQSDSGEGVVAVSRGIALRATGRTAAGHFRGDVYIDGSLVVTGAKSAVVPAPGGGLRQLYCVEAPEPWFEDLGESVVVNGVAEVRLDPAYAAVIRGNYQVHVTPYARAILWIGQRKRDRFIVRVTDVAGAKPQLRIPFSWRVVARRGDIKGQRFAKVKLPRPAAKEPVAARPNQATDFVVSPPIKMARKTRNPLGRAIAKRGHIVRVHRRRLAQRKKK